MGVASLALGPIGGVSAAAHFKAAAMFEAGAIAAGVVAHELGSGGGAGAGARPGGGVPTGGSAGGGNGSHAVIVYSDNFADDTARNRQRKAKRLVDQALGTGVRNE